MPAIRGSFAYGDTATVSASGSERKERFEPGAFRRSVEQEFAPFEGAAQLRALQGQARAAMIEDGVIPATLRRELDAALAGAERHRRMPEVSLLRGHNMDQPLASRDRGTLRLRDTSAALLFEAVLPGADHQPRYMRDSLLMLSSGLLTGVSPGFRRPPLAASPNAETLVQDRGETVFTRLIRDAVLFELSMVTRPAYKGTSLDEVRSQVWLVEDELELRDEASQAAFWGHEPTPTPRATRQITPVEEAFPWL